MNLFLCVAKGPKTFISQVRGESVELSVYGLFNLGKYLVPAVWYTHEHVRETYFELFDNGFISLLLFSKATATIVTYIWVLLEHSSKTASKLENCRSNDANDGDLPFSSISLRLNYEPILTVSFRGGWRSRSIDQYVVACICRCGCFWLVSRLFLGMAFIFLFSVFLGVVK